MKNMIFFTLFLFCCLHANSQVHDRYKSVLDENPKDAYAKKSMMNV